MAAIGKVIAPPPEQLRKGAWDVPHTTRTIQIKNYRSREAYEEMLRKSQITPEQYSGLRKLHKHMLGEIGVDVGDDDTRANEPAMDYSTTYHSQKVAEARDELSAAEWTACRLLLEKGLLPIDIGWYFKPRWSDEKMRRAYATAIIEGAADRLVKIWGLA